MFTARRKLMEIDRDPVSTEEAAHFDVARAEATWRKHWHASFEATGDALPLCRQCAEHSLTTTERELVVAMLLDSLNLIPEGLDTYDEVMNFLGLSPAEALALHRSLSDDGRLSEAGLVISDDTGRDIGMRMLYANPWLVEAVMHGDENGQAGWKVDTEEDLYKKLRSFTRACRHKAQLVGGNELGAVAGRRSSWRRPPFDEEPSDGDAARARHRAARLLHKFTSTLVEHRGWKIERLLTVNDLSTSEVLVFLVLLGKELGHVPADNALFLGIGLASAASEDADEVRENLSLLEANSALVGRGLVQPCGGDHMLLSGQPGELAEVEFQLAELALETLKIERRVSLRRLGTTDLRDPKVGMEQIVLSEGVQKALRMALAQVRNADVLAGAWGLGEVIPYGRAVTLLFSGPPGVGKTACAEALAQELGRPILVADYSQVQNCFVGQTEKNVVRTFRRAREHNAVLFWDEADAMFYDRDSSFRNFEVRNVNVLLQELEKFEGVCILATNRKISLDKALERRISLKVEFDRPDRRMRRDIWEILIPEKMPLADDVDLDALAREDLTGGEIKNVVLNAARISLARDREGSVTVEDLERAIEMETASRWGEYGKRRLGFGHS